MLGGYDGVVGSPKFEEGFLHDFDNIRRPYKKKQHQEYHKTS